MTLRSYCVQKQSQYSSALLSYDYQAANDSCKMGEHLHCGESPVSPARLKRMTMATAWRSLCAALLCMQCFVWPLISAFLQASPSKASYRNQRMQQAAVSAPSTSSATATESLAAKFGDAFATAVVGSPLYPFLMESARKTMKDAAERVGVQWDARVAELSAAKDWTAALEEVISSSQPVQVPDYYLKKFHAYEEGNLSFEAAFEQELASVAVGVRNYPDAAGVD
eukprot:9220-Heterococcus_DN1.PRE.1